MRKSFADYYYTKEASEGWDGKQHSTIFKARPQEWVKGKIAMPFEHAIQSSKNFINSVKSDIKSMINYD